MFTSRRRGRATLPRRVSGRSSRSRAAQRTRSRPSRQTRPSRLAALIVRGAPFWRIGRNDQECAVGWRAMRRATLSLLALLLATATSAQDCPAHHLDDVLSRIDAARLKATVDKLAAFGTRHTLSDTTSPARGIGAARKWIFDEMARIAAASNDRMTVAYQSSMQKSV